MREGFLFPGVVLMVLMILFAFVPLPYPANGTVAYTSPLVVHPPSFPYSQETPITLAWSGGNGTTWVQLVPCQVSDCSDVKPTTAVSNPVGSRTWSTIGNGGSGSLTVWVDTNESLMLLTNSQAPLTVTVSWNEMPEFALFWEILTFVALILCVAGMALPEKGSPRGHHRRLHYFHWRHHAFALPPHLPAAGLTCMSCGLTDIPHEDDACPRCHAPLPRASSMGAGGAPLVPVAAPGAPTTAAPEAAMAGGSAVAGAGADSAAGGEAAPAATPKKRTPIGKAKVTGQSLSVADPDPLKPWRVVKALNFDPANVLVFTREDREMLAEKFQLLPQNLYLVGRTEGERVVAPAEGDRIADLALQHLKTHAGGAVVLTDPNYFVTHVGFDTLRRLCLAIQDHAREEHGTFILAFNPSVLNPGQRAQLEERMRKVL